MLIPAARLSGWGHCTLTPHVGTVVRRVGTFGRAARSVAAMFNREARSVVQRVQSCSAFGRAARSIMCHVQSRCAFGRGPHSDALHDRSCSTFNRAAERACNAFGVEILRDSGPGVPHVRMRSAIEHGT